MKPGSVLLLVCLLAACGRVGFSSVGDAGAGEDSDGVGGDADADVDGVKDVSGFWLVQTAHEIGSAGSARERGDLVAGIRGDIRIDQDDARLRFILLGNSAPVGGRTYTAKLTATSTQWVFIETNVVSVFTAMPTGPDQYLFFWDADDPRTIGEPAFDTFSLAKVEPPNPMVIGTRTVTRLAYAGTGEFAAGSCAFDPPAGRQKVTGTVGISSDYALTLQFQFEYFTTGDCSGAPTLFDQSGSAYLEVDADQFRAWLEVEGVPPVFMTGGYTQPGGNLRLVRTGCTPTTPCAELPLILEMAP